ncbi:hypothetical protein VD659_18100 [Herbiconiux sp. 11R-BC]|uniref:hypothetical protein n=1 Tax=Herbiconiux sp. 11R-BC TaxID=3111637 RepID=UPI003C0F6898
MKLSTSTARKLSLSTATLGAVLLAVSVAIPAQAADPMPAPTSTVVEAHMSVIGFDAEVAAAHGYELRTADSGEQFSVPVANAPGDFSNSFGDGRPSDAAGLEVAGDCGTSWIYFQLGNTQFRTGYSIRSDRGQAFSHIWSATIATGGRSGGIGSYPLSGAAPANSAVWQAVRRIVEPYTSIGSAVAGGTAVTTAGWICGSGNPTAKY